MIVDFSAIDSYCSSLAVKDGDDDGTLAGSLLFVCQNVLSYPFLKLDISVALFNLKNVSSFKIFLVLSKVHWIYAPGFAE